jgi:hypothetical protein
MAKRLRWSGRPLYSTASTPAQGQREWNFDCMKAISLQQRKRDPFSQNNAKHPREYFPVLSNRQPKLIHHFKEI